MAKEKKRRLERQERKKNRQKGEEKHTKRKVGRLGGRRHFVCSDISPHGFIWVLVGFPFTFPSSSCHLSFHCGTKVLYLTQLSLCIGAACLLFGSGCRSLAHGARLFQAALGLLFDYTYTPLLSLLYLLFLLLRFPAHTLTFYPLSHGSLGYGKDMCA
ncbi:hypothetical protein V8C44DRAFT_306068 [Trichoderma aethiopicum]